MSTDSEKSRDMKHTFTCLMLIGGFGLLTLAVSCQTYQERTAESLLAEAGFQVRTPATPAQAAMYSQMTPYKIERNTINGKALYSYADKQKGVAYIGGGRRYKRYKQLSGQQRPKEAGHSDKPTKKGQVWWLNSRRAPQGLVCLPAGSKKIRKKTFGDSQARRSRHRASPAWRPRPGTCQTSARRSLTGSAFIGSKKSKVAAAACLIQG